MTEEDVHSDENAKDQKNLPEGFMDLVKAVSILLKIDRRLNPDKYKPEAPANDEV